MKHGLHLFTLCNAIATPCPETTARLYDYADDAKDVKKKNTKKEILGYILLLYKHQRDHCDQYNTLI
jgi:hypothetical protein